MSVAGSYTEDEPKRSGNNIKTAVLTECFISLFIRQRKSEISLQKAEDSSLTVFSATFAVQPKLVVGEKIPEETLRLFTRSCAHSLSCVGLQLPTEKMSRFSLRQALLPLSSTVFKNTFKEPLNTIYVPPCMCFLKFSLKNGEYRR